MLGFIRGRIISKNEDSHQCVILTHRLGYEITVPFAQLEKLTIDTETSLWLHTHVREDIFSLYGFLAEAEKKFFRVLLGVSGLGPKTAMALIGQHGVHRLVQLILEKNSVEISEAPGVGKKLAERIVLELGSKIEKLSFLKDIKSESETSSPGRLKLREDLYSALTNLGYPANTVRSTLETLFGDSDFEGIDFEVALKNTLKEMYRKQT